MFPQRTGHTPTTTPATPHVQLDQPSPPALQAELWRRMNTLDGVVSGRSHISAPSSRALHLLPALAVGPREAFLIGQEFAHLHGDGSGSLHLTVPRNVAAELMAGGWAEQHPVVAMGLGPSTLIMLFGPRDADELELAWTVVRASYAFATDQHRLEHVETGTDGSALPQ